MRATGMVRRIDDLGRVVIPRGIRRSMNIKEGDALEIFTDKDGCVIFKRYSAISEAEEAVQKVVQTAKMLNLEIGVYDTNGLAIEKAFSRFPDKITIGSSITKVEANGVQYNYDVIRDIDGMIVAYVVHYFEEDAIENAQARVLTKMLQNMINNA